MFRNLSKNPLTILLLNLSILLAACGPAATPEPVLETKVVTEIV